MKDKYSVTTLSVHSLLGYIESGEIAIPEMQRPSARRTWRLRLE